VGTEHFVGFREDSGDALEWFPEPSLRAAREELFVDERCEQ